MDTIRINVPLTKLEAQTLIALAKSEKRHPREQAAYLIARGLLIYKPELAEETQAHAAN